MTKELIQSLVSKEMEREFLTNNQEKIYLISELERTEIQDQDHIDLHQILVIMMEMFTTQQELYHILILVKLQEGELNDK